jgi:hypothetical protein
MQRINVAVNNNPKRPLDLKSENLGYAKGGEVYMKYGEIYVEHPGSFPQRVDHFRVESPPYYEIPEGPGIGITKKMFTKWQNLEKIKRDQKIENDRAIQKYIEPRNNGQKGRKRFPSRTKNTPKL